jgi:transposase-like protein
MEPDCPECGSDYVKKTTLLRIDPDTAEPLGDVQAFECTSCGTLFKEADD